MRDLLGGTKRKASFVGTHFMAICLGLLVLALALTMLTNCGGSGDGTAASTTRSYERTTATTESGSSTAYRSSAASTSGNSGTSGTKADGLRTVDYADLPKQAKDTIALIDAGGPFPYPRDDGKIFGNFEGLLPKQKRGYYREYTVPTPGADTRGARRIIRGQDGTMYYTSDHYVSFRRILR